MPLATTTAQQWGIMSSGYSYGAAVGYGAIWLPIRRSSRGLMPMATCYGAAVGYYGKHNESADRYNVLGSLYRVMVSIIDLHC